MESSFIKSIDINSHAFIKPARAIKVIRDMSTWEKSQAYSEYINFIVSLNRAISRKSLLVKCHVSNNVNKLISLLNTLIELIDMCPPIEQPQRFGNQAFRKWFEEMRTKLDILLKNIMPENLYSALSEITIYLQESFGNSTRIDYGTGHEASFVMFLYCLFRIGYLEEKDKAATVCLVFNKYLELVRKLQLTYKMEPAGSHGVWSLDDFQFVPFIWGSSQLIDHEVIEPSKFLDEEILAKYGKDYLFLSCIQFIQQVKTGPFAEHSNQLWGISAVASWGKINQGLIKMYTKEVLGKFPVVQHMLFGSLLSIQPQNTSL